MVIIFVIATFFNEAIKPNLGRLIKNSAKETLPVIPLPGIITVNILQLFTETSAIPVFLVRHCTHAR